MPNNDKHRIDLTQTTIDATGYKIADLIEEIINKKGAVSVCSKAFDYTAPDGEKLQVQLVVTREPALMLPHANIDRLNYDE